MVYIVINASLFYRQQDRRYETITNRKSVKTVLRRVVDVLLVESKQEVGEEFTIWGELKETEYLLTRGVES